jgi:hypothetical protein
MMSKERELLVRIVEADMVEYMQLMGEAEELLAQPEQEPEAWMSLSDIEWMNIVNDPKILELTDGRHNSEEAVNLAVKMTEEKCKKNNSDSTPKREPIDTRRITLKMFSAGVDMQYKNGYVDGIRFAEKMHGIGGGE